MNVVTTGSLWAADIARGAWLQTRYRIRPTDPAPLLRGELTPIVLLAGVYETWEHLLVLARRLNAAGHPVHVVQSLRRNLISIEQSALEVADYLEQHDLIGAIVLAHSKGGLIGKLVMSDPATGPRIDRMIAITAPFSGSSLSRYAPVRPLRAFRASDPMLIRLAAEQSVNGRIVSIYGSFDPLIPARSRLEGATNVELPVVGHFRVLSDRRVLDAVLAAIDGR